MSYIKEVRDYIYKINSLLSAIKAVAEKMPLYDSYSINALCDCGRDEITNINNIFERMTDE